MKRTESLLSFVPKILILMMHHAQNVVDILQILIKNNSCYLARVIAQMFKLEIPYYEFSLRND